MLDRLESTNPDGLTLNERLDPTMADHVLCTGHTLVLCALGAQIEHFKLDPQPFKALEADFQSVWKPPDLAPANAENTKLTGG